MILNIREYQRYEALATRPEILICVVLGASRTAGYAAIPRHFHVSQELIGRSIRIPMRRPEKDRKTRGDAFPPMDTFSLSLTRFFPSMGYWGHIQVPATIGIDAKSTRCLAASYNTVASSMVFFAAKTAPKHTISSSSRKRGWRRKNPKLGYDKPLVVRRIWIMT